MQGRECRGNLYWGARGPPRLEVELEALARAEHGEAFRLLGPHMVEREGGRRILVRTMQPYATAVSVVLRAARRSRRNGWSWATGDGVFEALMPPACQYLEARDYRLRIHWDDGSVSEVPDAYAFPPLLTDFDLHLLGEGRTGKATKRWARTCARSTACGGCSSRCGRRTRCA